MTELPDVEYHHVEIVSFEVDDVIGLLAWYIGLTYDEVDFNFKKRGDEVTAVNLEFQPGLAVRKPVIVDDEIRDMANKFMEALKPFSAMADYCRQDPFTNPDTRPIPKSLNNEAIITVSQLYDLNRTATQLVYKLSLLTGVHSSKT